MQMVVRAKSLETVFCCTPTRGDVEIFEIKYGGAHLLGSCGTISSVLDPELGAASLLLP